MLELDSITAGYGDTTVLREVSISVPTGSTVAILGPNGAGTTTLMRTMAGTLRPSEGQVRLDGEDITKLSAHRRVRLGVCTIPEGRSVFPSFSVKENLLMFSPKGKEKESIERATQAFPILGQRLGQTAGSLSGGEQQMLAIVRAYVTNPTLVLVDEASMGLAPLVVEVIFAFLRQLVAEGISLVIVEQYVTQALALADTAYVINQGRVVRSGPASEMESSEIFEEYLGLSS